jgi:hypothetical protein
MRRPTESRAQHHQEKPRLAGLFFWRPVAKAVEWPVPDVLRSVEFHHNYGVFR